MSINFKIRDAQPADMFQVVLIKNIAWTYAYKDIMSAVFLLNRTSATVMQSTITKWRNAMAQKTTDDKPFLVAETDDGIIVGFVFGGEKTLSALSTDKELHALYVHPAMHGLGIGKALLYAFAERMKRLGAKTFSVGCLSANKSLSFYKKMGGTVLFEIKNTHFENLPETFLTYQVEKLLATKQN